MRLVTRLANHRALTQKAEEEGLNGKPVRTAAWSTALTWVPLEMPASCCDICARTKTVVFPESGFRFL